MGSLAGPNPPPLFAVGIPVFNEEAILVENTERLLRFLSELGEPFEILLGSNGSTDRTEELCAQLAARDPRVRWFSLPRRGPGLVFRRFLTETRADRLISLDMDLSIDLGFVPRALELLASHELVVGSKRTGVQRRSWIRRAGSHLFVVSAALLLGLEVEDYSMAAKGYRVAWLRPVSDRLVAGTAYVLYALVATQRAGGRICQIPVDCDDHRASRFNLGFEALHKFAHLARLWVRPIDRPTPT